MLDRKPVLSGERLVIMTVKFPHDGFVSDGLHYRGQFGEIDGSSAEVHDEFDGAWDSDQFSHSCHVASKQSLVDVSDAEVTERDR